MRQRESYERDESAAHRLDRNYGELLQELRVAQLGVQVLFAFLLSIAFQQRFVKVTTFERDAYFAALLATTLAAVCFIAPVAMHRAMFRRHLKDELVLYTGRMLVGGLTLLALAMLAALTMIIDFVEGTTAAAVTVPVVALAFIALWVALPVRWRRRSPEVPLHADTDAGDDADGREAGRVF